jgi:hypothetical protein
MNGDEVVKQCLQEHSSTEEAWDCIRQYGADENLQKILREFGAGEELEKALREGDSQETQRNARRVLRKFAVDEAMEQAHQRKAALASIRESPVWKDPQFLMNLSRDFTAKDFEKSRETTKHYIDSAPKLNVSRMGNPLRGADGQLLRDGKGQVIWGDTSAEGQFNPTDVNLRNAQEKSGQDCGHCVFYRSEGSACQVVGGSVSDNLICDKFTAKPTLEQRVLRIQQGNMRADTKIDVTKSIMGNPVRNPDGSVSWVAK